MLEIRVLGPPEVVGPDGLIPIAGARQRAILALLALHHDRVVSSNQLIDNLWGDDPPATAEHALAVHISGLRKALGPQRIGTVGHGYRLGTTDVQTDLARFQALLADGSESLRSGDATSARDLFASALALWRGTALTDLAAGRTATSERTRLDELRDLARERWVDAQLAAGQHAELIPELRRQVEESPLREGLQVRLMLALYRAGRTADALETYRTARDVLDRELGVEPSLELEAMQRAILSQDAALNLSSPSRGTSASADAGSPPPEAWSSTAASPRPATVEGDDGRSASPATPSASRRRVTVLVADLHPTGDGDQDPEAASRVSDTALRRLRATLQRHGATLEGDLGESMIAVFGSPTVHEDDALRAVRAAAEMVDAAAADPADSPGAPPRIGIATGEALISADGRLAIGDTLARAQGLVGLNRAAGITLDDPTRALIRREAVTESLGLIAPAGYRAAMTVHRLQFVRSGAAGHDLRLDSPLVGRDRELRILHDALAETIEDGVCRLFSLLGPAGVGKSRLVHEFLGSVRDSVRILRGRCPPYGEGLALWPVRDVISQAADLHDVADPTEARRRIEGLLEGEPRASLVGAHVAAATGFLTLTSSAEETAWAFRITFEHMARNQPLVVVFDDIQWGDALFLNLLESIVTSAREAPILLLCIARPELLDIRPAWGGGSLHSSSQLLRPLGESDVAAVLANLLGGARLSPEVERRINAAAEGNPLFVEEYTATLLESGAVRQEAGVWVPTAQLSSTPPPASIMALLSARLDRLPPDERRVLELAAVPGKVFTRDALTTLAPNVPDDALDRRLESLARRELIRPDRVSDGKRHTYRFKHILIRDAAYAGLPKRDRIDAHERLADLLLARSQGGSTIDDELVGSHLEQAFRYRIELDPMDPVGAAVGRRAAAALSSAAARATVRGSSQLAGDLLQRAVALLPTRDPERLRLLSELAEAQNWRGEYDLGRATNDELLRLANELGLEAWSWRAKVRRIETEWALVAADEFAAVAVARGAIDFFEGTGDDRALGRAWLLQAEVNLSRAHYGSGRPLYERAARHAARASDIETEAAARIHIASLDMEGPPTVAAAVETSLDLLHWARATGQLGTEAIALAHLGRLRAMTGEFDEARRLVADAIAINLDLGRPVHVAADHPRWIGLVEWLAGDLAAAERGLREGYELLNRLGIRHHLSFVAGEMARMCLAQGRVDEADALTREAEAHSRPEAVIEMSWQGVRAMVLGRQGDIPAAVAMGQATVTRAATTDALWRHGRALEDLAEVWRLGGRGDLADRLTADAIRLYSRKGITALVAPARARLGT